MKLRWQKNTTGNITMYMNAKVLAIGLLFGLKNMPEIHECAKDKTMHLLLDVHFSKAMCHVCLKILANM